MITSNDLFVAPLGLNFQGYRRYRSIIIIIIYKTVAVCSLNALFRFVETNQSTEETNRERCWYLTSWRCVK